MKSPITVLFLVFWLELGAASQHSNLTLIMMTSFGQYGFNSSGFIPAADMALEDINANTEILPGYHLGYNTLRDTKVKAEASSIVCKRSQSCL